MKFFEFLGQCQEQWKAIKEENPLNYMSYMESHFERLTGVKLTGLGHFMCWIKPGSYYHGVVVKQGQLGLCVHLAGQDPLRPPLVPPHPTRPVTRL